MITSVSAGDIRHTQTWVDLEGHVAIRQNFSETTLRETDPGSQVVDRRSGLARNESKNLIVIGNGGFEVPPGVEGVGPAQASLGIIGPDTDATVEIGQCANQV